jgi:hypothetical protein
MDPHEFAASADPRKTDCVKCGRPPQDPTHVQSLKTVDGEGFINDGHKITLEFESDNVRIKLLHPPKGCIQATCPDCYGEGKVDNGPFDEDGKQVYRKVDCDVCGGTGQFGDAPCWLTDWFENLMPMEMYDDGPHELAEGVIPIPIKYRSGGMEEGPEWRIVND